MNIEMNTLETPIIHTEITKRTQLFTRYTFAMESWVLHKEITLVICLYSDESIQPFCIRRVIDGEEYQQWGNDDTYIEDIVQQELQKLRLGAKEEPPLEEISLEDFETSEEPTLELVTDEPVKKVRKPRKKKE